MTEQVKQVPMWQDLRGRLHKTKEDAEWANYKLRISDYVNEFAKEAKWPKAALRSKRSIVEFLVWASKRENVEV